MALCEILNAFPVSITRFRDYTLELPGEDLSFGIRHILYFLLRSDYLKASPVARCAWHECAKWFRVGPQKSPCCCADHALKFRQRVYYHEGKGRKKRVTRYRKERNAKLKPTSKRRK